MNKLFFSSRIQDKKELKLDMLGKECRHMTAQKLTTCIFKIHLGDFHGSSSSLCAAFRLCFATHEPQGRRNVKNLGRELAFVDGIISPSNPYSNKNW